MFLRIAIQPYKLNESYLYNINKKLNIPIFKEQQPKEYHFFFILLNRTFFIVIKVQLGISTLLQYAFNSKTIETILLMLPLTNKFVFIN